MFLAVGAAVAECVQVDELEVVLVVVVAQCAKARAQADEHQPAKCAPAAAWQHLQARSGAPSGAGTRRTQQSPDALARPWLAIRSQQNHRICKHAQVEAGYLLVI